MDSYKKLKEEMDSLQEQKEKTNLEIYKLLEPLYEIASEYPDHLSNILPKNISAINEKRINLRLTVFEEEAKTLQVEETKKLKILKLITEIKNEINEKNNQLKIINEKMATLSPVYEQRRNYILEKIEKINPIEEEIKELEKQIDLHKKYLEKTNWSKKIEEVFINVIEDYKNQINEKKLIIRKIVGDETTAEDIKLLSGLEVEPQYKNQEEITEDINISEAASDIKIPLQIKNNAASDIKIPLQIKNNKEEMPTTSSLKNIFEEKLKDFYSFTSVPEEEKAEDKKEEPKPKELSEEQKATLKSLRNIFEDDLRDINSDTHIYNMDMQETYDPFEENYFAEDVHYNPQLQEEVKKEKRLRIKLGLSNLSSRISKLLPEKESMTVKRTRKLYKKLKKIKKEYSDVLERYEIKRIDNVLMKVELILEYTFDENDLIKLEDFNNELDRYITDTCNKYDQKTSSLKRIR